jgi:hypothetical protein
VRLFRLSSRNTIWGDEGSDINYRNVKQSQRLNDLRDWMDETFFNKGVSQYLDANFLSALRNNDFNARLWELVLADKLKQTGLNMVPTRGSGFDFHLILPEGTTVLIEAVHATASVALQQAWLDRLKSRGGEYDTQIDEVALRYSSALYTKAVKIRDEYQATLSGDEVILIGIASLDINLMWSGLDTFMKALYPIGAPVVHFSTDRKALDPSIRRSTHAAQEFMVKTSGIEIAKNFLFPGDDYPFINGVLFSEASDVQEMRGTSSSSFNKTTRCLHSFSSYRTGPLPLSLTKHFYHHEISDDKTMISVRTMEPHT